MSCSNTIKWEGNVTRMSPLSHWLLSRLQRLQPMSGCVRFLSSHLPWWLMAGARQCCAVLILWSNLLLAKEKKEEQRWQQQLLISVFLAFPSRPCHTNMISSGQLVSSFSHAAARRASKSLLLANTEIPCWKPE